jgi:serine/threonine protein kinase
MAQTGRIDQYEIQKLLGSGGSAEVFQVKNSETSEKFALKLSNQSLSFEKELKITKSLSHISGVPKIYNYGQFNKRPYFVSQLLGRNLSYNNSEKPFSLQFISKVAWQLLILLEKIHEIGVIHKDLKPSNILLSSDNSQIFLIDFGISSTFLLKGSHKRFKTTQKLIGTPGFASINTHFSFKASRRDDLESLCYSLIYLFFGKLPWRSFQSLTSLEKWKFILKNKQNFLNTPESKILPQELCEMLKYSRSLNYEQSPNYQYLRSLCEKLSGMTTMDFKIEILQKKEKRKVRKSQKLQRPKKNSNIRNSNKTVKFFKDEKVGVSKKIKNLSSCETTGDKRLKLYRNDKEKGEKNGKLAVSISQVNLIHNKKGSDSESDDKKLKISSCDTLTSHESSIDSDPLTPKSDLPEFKNRFLIFKQTAKNNSLNPEDIKSCILF